MSLFSRWWLRRQQETPPNLLTRPVDLGAKDYREVDILAVDLELSALDPSQGSIVSIGFVPIIKGEIAPGLGKHLLISDHGGVNASATIHGIRDCDAEFGVPLQTALQQLQQNSRNKICLFHYATLDLGFISHAGYQLEPVAVIDTLLVERRRLQKLSRAVSVDSLRLVECRHRYGLPDYPAHNSFIDALATAELLLAQITHLTGKESFTINELVMMSRS